MTSKFSSCRRRHRGETTLPPRIALIEHNSQVRINLLGDPLAIILDAHVGGTDEKFLEIRIQNPEYRSQNGIRLKPVFLLFWLADS